MTPLVKVSEQPPGRLDLSFKIDEKIVSFKLPATPENIALLKELRMMAARDGWSLSRLIRTAVEEYFERHKPGNPQLGLVHWTEGDPLPKSTQKYQRPKSKDELFQEMTDRLTRRLQNLPSTD
jgi:hypothetical protein